MPSRVPPLSPALVLAAASALGCAAPPAAPTPGLPSSIPVTPIRLADTGATRALPPSAVVSVVSPPALGALTGVAVVPETGARLALFESGDILDLSTGRTIWTPPVTAPATAPFGYTDLVALSPTTLALTAPRDGFLVDLETGALTPHFCYEPGEWEEIPNEPVQVSSAVTLDPTTGHLYAQPRTIESAGWGATVGAFVASYDRAGGADLSWWALPDSGFVGGGMVAPGAGALLIGQGTRLLRFDPERAELSPAADLASLGVGSIEGLAIDAEAATLLVADAANGRIVELRLDAVLPPAS